MEWSEEGIVLAARKHGESSAIITVLTRDHGRHAGLVRGGAGRRSRGVLQPGNRIEATWRARLDEHLGTFTCELLEARAAALLDDPLRLAGLSAACAVADAALPEREPHRAAFAGLSALLDALKGETWPPLYVRWELDLLRELGFGLDFSTCAATGRTEQLVYVSPKSGRAVSRPAGKPYGRALLALPPFLLGAGDAGGPDRDLRQVLQGLELTGFFLERHVFGPKRRPPAARERLKERLTRRAAPDRRPAEDA